MSNPAPSVYGDGRGVGGMEDVDRLRTATH